MQNKVSPWTVSMALEAGLFREELILVKMTAQLQFSLALGGIWTVSRPSSQPYQQTEKKTHSLGNKQNKNTTENHNTAVFILFNIQ